MTGAPILLWMARHGVLQHLVTRNLIPTGNAASPKTIEDMEVVTYDPGIFADPADQDDPRPLGECCICLEPYDEHKEIKRTSCGHLMHTECLQVWLSAARTCPTCRSDLEAAHGEHEQTHSSAA